MPKHNNAYTVVFVAVLAVIFAALLSMAASMLREKQERNVVLDQKRNVLKSFGLESLGLTEESTDQEVEDVFASRVTAIAVNQHGEEIEGVDVAKLKLEDERAKDLEANPDAVRHQPVYILKGDGGEPIAYAIPVIGKGLWSTLYGYFSLESDLNTVRGITFYKHGETPGLGGEIDAEWFQENFVGKKIYNDGGELVAVRVVKGKAADRYSGDALQHYVDGISGATLTSNGVTNMLVQDLEMYKPYFSRLRAAGGE